MTTTMPSTSTNKPIKISIYSTLDSALDINVHGKLEVTISIYTTMTPQSLTTYNPQYHYSDYSTLVGALG